MLIFKKDFLDELEEKFRHVDSVDIVMHFCDIEFEEAILRIAKYCDMEPIYFERKKVSKQCKAALHEKDL